MAFVITIAQQKGGAGKTTLTAHIAVALSQKGNKVAIIDIDPQKSLKTWYNLRKERFGEEYTGLSFSEVAGWRVSSEISRLKQTNDYVIIDCPPQVETETRFSISEADLVVIPVQPSPTDIWATKATIEIARSENRKFVTIFNRMPSSSKLAKELSNELPNLIEFNLGNRVIFSSSFLTGRCVTEIEPSGTAALEVKNLVKKLEKILNKNRVLVDA